MNDSTGLTCNFKCQGGEPSLDEALADPVVRLVMARDGVELDSLRDAMTDVQSRLLARRTVELQTSF